MTHIAKEQALAKLKSYLNLDQQALQSLARPVAIQVGIGLVCLAGVWGLTQQEIRVAKARAGVALQGYADIEQALTGKDKPQLELLRDEVTTRWKFLRQAVVQRISVTEKLDALAKLMPDGVWLDSISYFDRLSHTGAAEPTMRLQGNCFLPGRGNELTVVSDFVQEAKRQEDFFQGFATAQLIRILEAEDPAQKYSYRTFELDCTSKERQL